MIRIRSSATIAAALAGLALTFTPTSADVLFSESFESPEVSGFASNTVPDTGWVGAANGYGANNRGLYNETVAWPATPNFTTPYGEQAYLLNYTNSGLTTAQGTISEVLTVDETYTVSFNAAVQAGTASGSYTVEFVAFDPADDNAARTDAQAGRPGTVLATASGTVTTNDMSESGSLVFTPIAGDPSLGKEIGIRLIKGSNSVLYDNIRLIIGHDLAPTPADGVTIAGGSVPLSWTNMPPNTGTDVYVDVWFGTDPGALDKVEDGALNLTTTTVNAPMADSYYWRVDSYVDGDAPPVGTPVEGSVFVFYVIDTDGDGFPDTYELANTDPPSNIALNPGDDLENGGAGDGLTNEQEYQYGTDPNDPDCDNDNLDDGPEIAGAGLRPPTSPLDADSDDDGLDDNVETNTGTWAGTTDSGTDPTDSDYDNDGLPDGVETKTGTFVGRTTDTGTDPYLPDTDSDGAGDWYEVAATFTDPNSDTETPDIPYPLPDPDGSTGATDKPVKVYIMSGQSNMVGIGYIDGTAPGSMETVTMRDNKFPNMVEGGAYTERNDVLYRGVVTAIGDGPLTVGVQGNRIGPEQGFGHVMGWYHDEPVLIIKSSQGNRSLGWDFLPPGSAQFDYTDGNTYAGYGESPLKWSTGTDPEPIGWYAGKQYDDCFLDEADWAPAGAAFDPITNVADILANFDTLYPDWASQGYEIAGFVWWQGHKDRSEDAHHSRYETNLVNLINALRTEFNAPNAPFVVATIGFDGGGYAPGSAYDNIYTAQLAVGDPLQHPEFTGTVASVDTTGYWRTLAESPGGQGFHYNNNAETYTLVGDAVGRAMLTMQDDATPPNPDPMTFATTPTAVDTTTVGMVATTASDAFGPVEYYFENTTNSDLRDWSTDPGWNNTGLSNGVSYNFHVRARDANGNETAWSAETSAAPGNDVTAPSPDPMSFATPPSALGEGSITMTATTATDINGVEYFFDCTTAGGHDSGWQNIPAFTDIGLSPGTEYTYQVQARDKSTGQNATALSGPASAITTAPDLTPPAIDTLSPDNGSVDVAVDTNLVLTFDEDIAAGTGLITLKNLSDSTQSMIDITDGTQVSITGPVLTIDPSSDLAEDKDYAIQIDATAIDDLVGNSFAGISDDTTWAFATLAPPPVGILFSEDFENPPNADVEAYDQNPPNPPQWVAANQGYNGNKHGLTDKAGGDFSAADPNHQAYAFRYTNSGLTTAEGVIGTLAADTTYTVSFDVVKDSGAGSTGTPYSVQWIAFGAGAARNDCRSTPAGSTVLASAGGNAPEDGSFATISFEFTPDAGAHAAHFGKDLGIRLIGATNSAIIDNLQVSSVGPGGGNDYDTWAADYPGADLSDPAADFDGDGLSNDDERAWGLDPTNAASVSPVGVPLDRAAGTFSYTRRDPALSGISYGYQWSSTLDGTWTPFTPVQADLVSPIDGTDNQEVVVDMTGVAGAPLDNPKLFVQVVAN